MLELRSAQNFTRKKAFWGPLSYSSFSPPFFSGNYSIRISHKIQVMLFFVILLVNKLQQSRVRLIPQECEISGTLYSYLVIDLTHINSLFRKCKDQIKLPVTDFMRIIIFRLLPLTLGLNTKQVQFAQIDVSDTIKLKKNTMSISSCTTKNSQQLI